MSNIENCIVIIRDARLNKKGCGPNIRTWWRIRRAVKRAGALRVGQIHLQYLVIPSGPANNAEGRMWLSVTLFRCDGQCLELPIMPAMGEDIPPKEQEAFARRIAESRGALPIFA